MPDQWKNIMSSEIHHEDWDKITKEIYEITQKLEKERIFPVDIYNYIISLLINQLALWFIHMLKIQKWDEKRFLNQSDALLLIIKKQIMQTFDIYKKNEIKKE